MVIKKIWEYIKSNDLQDPADRRFILCDSLLKPIMGGLDRVSSFKMNTYLAKHLKQKEKVVGGNVAGELVEDSDDDEAAASGNAPAAFAPRGLKSAETVSDGDGDSDE